MTHLLLCGNAYAQIIRNGKGEIIALYPLMPNRMTVDRDDKGKLYYQYQMQDPDAPTMKTGTVKDPAKVRESWNSAFGGSSNANKVGDLEKSSFSNIEQQSLEFVKYTLEP